MTSRGANVRKAGARALKAYEEEKVEGRESSSSVGRSLSVILRKS